LATLALHIGQPKVCAAAIGIAKTLINNKFANRLSLISPPEKDQRQQVNPKRIQEMPV
jgi:hypothetical protein